MAQPYPRGLAVGEGQRWIAILARNCMNIDMAQMNVSLPEGLKAWAEARVAAGRYSSTSNYVRDLTRRDMEAAAERKRLEKAGDDGMSSPVSTPTTDDTLPNRTDGEEGKGG